MNSIVANSRFKLPQTPLDRAYDLMRRGTPPREWPDAELNAFTDAYCRGLRNLSDAELEALLYDGTK